MGKAIRVIILVTCQACGKQLHEHKIEADVPIGDKEGLEVAFMQCPDHRNSHINLKVLVV